MGVVTGAHMLLPAVTNIVVMFLHPQPTMYALVMHRSFGVIFLIAALFRLANNIPAYAWVGTLAAFCFPFSAPEMTCWASQNYTPGAYLLLYLCGCSLTWFYHTVVWMRPGSLRRPDGDRVLVGKNAAQRKEYEMVPSQSEDTGDIAEDEDLELSVDVI